jgi:hypothetical protein
MGRTGDLIELVSRAARRIGEAPRPLAVLLLAAVAATAAGGVAASALTIPPRPSIEPPAGSGRHLVAAGLGRSVPVRIVIPSIDVDAEVVSVGLAGGRLATPRDATRAGWYERGTSPGELGSAVIVGHATVPEWLSGGRAVFARLDRVAVGDSIRVLREDGTVASFQVDRVEEFSAARASHDTGSEAQLRLVSTDRTDPLRVHRTVVWATLAQ